MWYMYIEKYIKFLKTWYIYIYIYIYMYIYIYVYIYIYMYVWLLLCKSKLKSNILNIVKIKNYKLLSS